MKDLVYGTSGALNGMQHGGNVHDFTVVLSGGTSSATIPLPGGVLFDPAQISVTGLPSGGVVQICGGTFTGGTAQSVARTGTVSAVHVTSQGGEGVAYSYSIAGSNAVVAVHVPFNALT